MFSINFKNLLLVILFVYLICFCFFFYSHPVKILSQWDWAKGINNDFGIYQQAARHFIKGKNIYNEPKYIYPPSFAILLSPALNLPVAYQRSAWVALNLIMVVALWFLLAHCFVAGGLKKYQAFVISLLVIVSSIPLIHNFKWGQVSLLISLLVLISYIAFKRNIPLLSALALAIASSIKIIPAFFLLFYIANWKKGVLKLILWFIVFSSLMLLLLPILTLGYRETCHTYNLYYEKMTTKDRWKASAVWNSQSITGILFRYFSTDYALLKTGKRFPPFPHRPPRFLPFQTFFTAQRAHTVGTILSLLFLMFTLYLCRRKHCHPGSLQGDEQEDLRFCLFISGCLMCTNHAWIHYYVLLILPYYLLLTSLIKNEFNRSHVVLGLLAISFTCNHGNIFLLKSTYLLELFEYLGVFYWANILLFVSLLLYLNRRGAEVSKHRVTGSGYYSKRQNKVVIARSASDAAIP